MHEQTRKPGRELLLDIQYVVRLRIRSKQQSTRERWHVIWNQQNVYRPVSLWWQYTWDNTHSFWNPISMSPAETMPTVVLVKRDTKIATSWGMGEVIWWGWRGDYYSLKRRSPSKLSLTIVVLTSQLIHVMRRFRSIFDFIWSRLSKHNSQWRESQSIYTKPRRQSRLEQKEQKYLSLQLKEMTPMPTTFRLHQPG